MTVQRPSTPKKLITALLSAMVLVSALAAQPSGPPKGFVLPDLSTVPGAVTFPADMFDLSESHYKYDGQKWMSLDLPEHSEASASIRVPVGSANYTIVVDAAVSMDGASSFWVEVNDTKLDPKEVAVGRSEAAVKRGRMLMWPEVEIPSGATITVHGKVDPAAAEDGSTATASWSRLLLLPHNMGPGGPPMAPPPSPPTPPPSQ